MIQTWSTQVNHSKKMQRGGRFMQDDLSSPRIQSIIRLFFVVGLDFVMT